MRKDQEAGVLVVQFSVLHGSMRRFGSKVNDYLYII